MYCVQEHENGSRPTMYYARGAVAEMGLNRDCMVALAMLMGGDYDYIEGIKVVGLVNIMEILDAFDVGCG